MWLPWRRKNKREIFEFRDGAGKLRRIDPMVAYRRLTSDPQLNAEEHFGILESESSPPEMLIEASTIAAAAARRIFGLAEFSDTDPASVTDNEAKAILIDFVVWVDAQKKSASPSPTLPPAMAPAS